MLGSSILSGCGTLKGSNGQKVSYWSNDPVAVEQRSRDSEILNFAATGLSARGASKQETAGLGLKMARDAHYNSQDVMRNEAAGRVLQGQGYVEGNEGSNDWPLFVNSPGKAVFFFTSSEDQEIR